MFKYILSALLFCSQAHAERTVMEGKASTKNSIFVSSMTSQVLIATNTVYGGAVANIGLFTTSGAVMDAIYLTTATASYGFFGPGSGITGLDCIHAAGTLSIACQGSGNTAPSAYGTTSGGYQNNAQGSYSVVAGGKQNIASNLLGGSYTTVSGGYGNQAQDDGSTIGGGTGNTCNGSGGSQTIGGGWGNIAAGQYATIPGGYQNSTTGIGSFAAGMNAASTGNHSFTWSDGNVYSGNGGWTFSVNSTSGTFFNNSVQIGNTVHHTTITASGYMIFPPWTVAQLQAATPTSGEVGGLIMCTNCSTAFSICQSTGAVLNGFRLGLSGTTACQ